MSGARVARVRVSEDRVVAASPVPGEPFLLPRIARATTIDDLFEALRRDLQRADEVRVSYDPTWGFPRFVSVNPETGVIDEEYGYGVRQFLPLPRQRTAT
jgi:hypothetical protein